MNTNGSSPCTRHLGKQRLALLGSSHVTRFPGSVLQDLGYGVVKKFGIPGVKSSGISDKLLDEVLAFQPSMCFIMLGGNDLDSPPNDLDLASVVEHFLRIIKRLHANQIRVVVSEILYRGNCRYTTPELYQKLRSGISKRLRKVLKKYNSTYVHYHGLNRASFGTDLIHLNHDGYKRIVRTLKNLV